jgi:hypothetical protein
VVSPPDERLDEMAKSSREGDGSRRRRWRECDRRRCFDSVTRGGSGGALDGIESLGGFEDDDWGCALDGIESLGGLEDDWGFADRSADFVASFLASFFAKVGKGRSSTCVMRRGSFA